MMRKRIYINSRTFKQTCFSNCLEYSFNYVKLEKLEMCVKIKTVSKYIIS